MLVAAAPAAAQEVRVDARLRFHARFGAAPTAAAVTADAARAAAVAGTPDTHVRAVVRIRAAGRAALERHGARIRAVMGDVVTATLPLAALPALVAERDIVFIEAAAWLDAPRPVASADAGIRDSAATDDAGLDILRQRTGDAFDGATGAGVIVGIYDSGLDLSHPDFRDAAGDTRVLYAWDQAEAGSGPGVVGESVFDYGTECAAVQIDAGACPMRDRNGHGTHVAGIAAGDGSAAAGGAEPYRFIGAAPAADLIVVKGGDTGYTSDRLLDGVAYIFERAAQLGRPAVVNLSVGTQQGPHDGSTVFERALENMLGSGRIIVVAAGNQGNNVNETPAFVRQSLHAMGNVSTGTQAHELVVPGYEARAGMVNDAAVLELWYDGDDDLVVGVRAPSGELVARLEPGDSVIALSPEGAVFIDNAGQGRDPNNGDRMALISIFDADAEQPPVPGAWRIEVERVGGAGSGDYHLWLVGTNLNTTLELATLQLGTTNTHLVALPGTAARLITVGAHVTRHTWLGPDGSVQVYPFREALGDLAHFSSPGPRRDGVLKPDLTAPGKVVVAARSRDAGLWSPLPGFVDVGGEHAVLFGTSMATPYAVAVVALLLQFAPGLTPEEARTLLVETATADAFTARSFSVLPGGVPNVHWGYGKLNATAAVHTLPLPSGTLVAEAAPLPAPARVPARTGARTALLTLAVAPDSVEAVHLDVLAVDVEGGAPGTLFVARDDNDDGVLGDGDPVVGSAILTAGGGEQVVATGAVVKRGESARFLVGVAIGEGAVHGDRLALTMRPEASRFVGTLSGTVNAWQDAPPASASSDIALTVLGAEQRWSISENPVRSERLIVNFDEPPRTVRIYTLGGALVRDLLRGDAVERVEWLLDNEAGSGVSSGVYLLLVEFPDRTVTRKLLVLRSP